MADDNKRPEPPTGEDRADPKRKKPLVSAGVAMGIGSAAIVAALLYANRNRRTDRDRS